MIGVAEEAMMSWREMLKSVLEGQSMAVDRVDELPSKSETGFEIRLSRYAVGWRAKGRKEEGKVVMELLALRYDTERTREEDFRMMPTLALELMRCGVDVDWEMVTGTGCFGIVVAFGRGRLVQSVTRSVVKRAVEAIKSSC